MLKGFILEKEDQKTMTSETGKNTNQSKIESKKQAKQTKNRDRIMDTESILMVARWARSMGENG